MVFQKKFIMVIILVNNILFPDCPPSILGDVNNDDSLNILDIVGITSVVLEFDHEGDSIDIQADINNDDIVDILDIILLIQKVLNPIPSQVSILSVNNSIHNLNIQWSLYTNSNFSSYEIFKSTDLNGELEQIYIISDQSQTSVNISDLYLYEEAWFWVKIVDHWGCSSTSNPFLVEHFEKSYSVNEFGQIIHSEMDVNDFMPSDNCIECHESHVNEWRLSSHGRNMHSDLFFSLWEKEQDRHPDVGEKFCIQCHGPVSFVTGFDMSDFDTPEQLMNSNVPDVIKEGVTCSVCHSSTHLSSTYFADNSLSPNAEYHLYPGEGVFFGPIQNPDENSFHSSSYSEMFTRSEMCLPCHDLVIRDVEAEITFTEWNRIPGFAMSGGVPCQQCHMPTKEDGTHDHQFVGVDVDLSYPLGTSPQHIKVADMLTNAVSIEYGADSYSLNDSALSGNEFIIPITITSNTAHNLPSGTAHNRECWVECIVTHNSDTLFSSGLVSSNYSALDVNDSQLLLFTSYLLDEVGDTTFSITETHDIINRTLPALGSRFHLYTFVIPEDVVGLVDIYTRIVFRPFRPLMIEEEVPQFLHNLPIFDMASIHAQIEVFGQ